MIEADPQKNISPRLAQVERWVPGIRTFRTYKRAWLPRDIVSGAVLCALLVPQGMAYAQIAGVPPHTSSAPILDNLDLKIKRGEM